MLLKELLHQKPNVFAVNLLGEPCEFDEIIKICDDNNLLLLEDNCESMGAKYKDKYSGTIGLMSSQSTYMSHHISTIEGGFILHLIMNI